MQVVNVRQLKDNPSQALREARDDLVVVMNRDRPDALLVGMQQLGGIPEFERVREALAVGLFRDRQVSVSMAAKIAGRSLSDMLRLLSRLGLPVADASVEGLRAEAALAERLLARRPKRDARRHA
jgi:predicted HTH domain antitoxin